MIEIQNVSFEYEKSQGTLSHIDLNIQQGECSRVMMPSTPPKWST